MKLTKSHKAWLLALVMTLSVLTPFCFSINASSAFNNKKSASKTAITVTQKGAIFKKNEYFASSHASTVLKLKDGSVLSAWFGGSGEKGSDVRIWYARFENGKWGKASFIPSKENVAHWNPVLQDFGTYVRLYYKFGKDTKSWITKYVDSFDGGKSWTEPKELVPGDTSGGRGPVRSKCLVTSTGVIIAPASTEQGTWKSFFDISEDNGATWKKTDKIVAKNKFGKTVGMIQPTLWEDANGEIHALFRTKKNGKIFRADSTDGGYTWGKAYATNMPNNNSGIDVARSDNGWLWLVYNPIRVDSLRYKLSLAVSKDNGKTWQKVMDLEKSLWIFNEFSYPSIVAEGNSLYITYTYKRQQIKYCFIEF